MIPHRVKQSIEEEAQRLENALARGVKRLYAVELIDKGTWYNKGHFDNKAVAIKRAQRLSAETGRRSRVVESDIKVRLQSLSRAYQKLF